MQLNRSTQSALKLGAAIGLIHVFIARIYIASRTKFLQQMPSIRMLTIIID